MITLGRLRCCIARSASSLSLDLDFHISFAT